MMCTFENMKSRVTKLIFVSIFVCMMVGCSADSDQSVTTSKESQVIALKDTAARDSVVLWLSQGEYVADVLSAYSTNDKLEKYNGIIMENVEKNQDWFLEYTQTVAQAGSPLPYHPNFGLSEAEYADFLALSDSVVPMSEGQEKITVVQSENEIRFRATGSAKGLRNMIYIKSENAFYLEMPGIERSPALLLSDTLYTTISNPNHPLGTHWQGYVWQFREGDSEDDILQSGLENASYSTFKLVLGVTSKKDIYFNFQADIVDQGTSLANNRLPLIFR